MIIMTWVKTCLKQIDHTNLKDFAFPLLVAVILFSHDVAQFLKCLFIFHD